MKITFLCGLLCFASIVSGVTPAAEPLDQLMDVEDILQNNFRAVRPESAFNEVENTEIVIRISEADFSLIARYRASSEGYMRIDLFDGHTRVYSEGKDERGVWEWPGGKGAPEDVYHDGVAAVEHGIEFNLFPLAELPGRGHEIELVGSEMIRDTEYFVLKVTLSDGFETYRYVNADTWLVDLSRDFRAFHPGVDSTKKNLETRYDQWKRTDGVVFASRTRNVDLELNAVVATTVVLNSRYNIARQELDLSRDYVPSSAPTLRGKDHPD